MLATLTTTSALRLFTTVWHWRMYNMTNWCATVLLISNATSQPSDLTEATVSQFRKVRVHRGSMLLTPGQQCRVCLRQYAEGDVVRYLPCRHHFHVACIDQWLLHRRPTCPVDGVFYTNESVRLLHKAQRQRSVCKTSWAVHCKK